jgi:SAM-dependent methyltransferase
LLIYQPLQDYRERVEEVAQTFESNPTSMALYRRVTERVDPRRVADLQHKYAEQLVDFDPIGLFKYADLPFWLADKVNTVRQLGLDKGEPRTILDIGMGAGHFAALCQALGHTVVGTDISVPLYNDICEVLQVDRRIEPTRLRTPLPDLGRKFDLVTVIWQVFHVLAYHPNGDRDHWTPEDWRFFLDDLTRHHMRYPGAIFLHLNRNVMAAGEAFDAPLLQWCKDVGGKVDEVWGKVLFAPLERPDAFAGTASAASVAVS